MRTTHRVHTAASAGDSQNIVIGTDGTPGIDGPAGTPGSEDMGPGSGQDGQGGGGTLNVSGRGSHLVFSKTAPLGAWTVSVTSGHSGSGGRGGDGGTAFFSGDPDFPQIGAGGGNGANGGSSGEAIATLHSKVVFGFTGTAAGKGIDITVDALGGEGGTGGNGGNGSSGSGFNGFGGSGGNAGDGGWGGSALATFTNGVVKPVIASQPNVFDLSFDLTAQAGDGAAGGQGGLGGFGTIFSPNGNSGTGGSGGTAEMDFVQNVFHLNLSAAHSTTTLTIIADANGGDGGAGGLPPSGSGGGAGGNGGNALAIFSNNTIIGGGANDLVRIAVNAAGGAAGIGANGQNGSVGTSTISFGANSFEGGAGNNTLAFTWDSHTTASYIVCDLAAGELYVGSAVKSTIQNFQNITGGSGDDRISGDGNANKLVGSQGDDSINGLGGKDIIKGGGGSDFLDGGAGKDTFVYKAASDSTGMHRDIIDDFDFALDKIDVTFKVKGIGHVLKESLSTATFNRDLAAHVDSGHLLAHHAMLVTAQGGDLDERMYLVIDANGKAGYQAGADLVIEVSSPSHVGMLSVDTFV